MTGNIFDPVLYSIAENQFLAENVGKPPVVIRNGIPVGVNPKAVLPVLNRVYELTEQEKHSGLQWVGVEALKACIKTYLTQAEKWENDRRRGAPRFPSTFSFDSRGRGHKYGPGSDSWYVKTYFDKDGNRVPFALDLIPDGQGEWTPDWVGPADDGTNKDLKVNHELNRIECFCGHVEKYKAESRGSFNAARGRISKHLRNATDEVERHRDIYTLEFGS